jgi:hypothetical protein
MFAQILQSRLKTSLVLLLKAAIDLTDLNLLAGSHLGHLALVHLMGVRIKKVIDIALQYEQNESNLLLESQFLPKGHVPVFQISTGQELRFQLLL